MQIGIINTDFDFLNYNEENESLGGLRLVNGVYQPIAGKPSAYTKHVTIIAPLTKTVTAFTGSLTIGVNPQLFFNLDKKITQINADFGSGFVPIVTNQIPTNNSTVSYTTAGDKTITFNITYSDGTTLTSYAKINVIFGSLYTGNSTARTTTANCIKTDVTAYTSKIAYKAWTETTPLYGKLEYKIFYANSNQTGVCGIDRVKKPFVVVDGFDPGDKRKIELEDCDGNCQEVNKDALTDTFIPEKYKSIERLMRYKEEPLNPLSQEIRIITKLNEKGFDVIIVNLPTDRNPSDYNDILHDYGADFIERNAMTFASFLKDLNASIKTRGITEKAVVVGPSMGGQITRYALAYMEKQQQTSGDITWNHNTRLWVSMDSPHQGANVPLSIQGSTYFLGYVRGQEKAKKSYDEKLLAPATREMLIEHNKEAINQLFTNPPSPYFTNYHTNLDSNGLPNSKGYPINLRKIAITNGSLSGLQEASPGQTALDMRGYIDFSIKILGVRIGWKINLFRSVQNYQYPYGQSGQIYGVSAAAVNPVLWISEAVTRQTVKSLGSLDVVSGGLANSINDFKEESIGALTMMHLRKDMKIPSTQEGLVVPHAFIPTHSALDTNGFANWHQPINVNLVCTGQTPFDSYFGEAVNRDHIFFTKESINWLLKELGDSTHPPVLQAPSFPMPASVLTGTNTTCLNINNTYQLDPCKVPSPATWAVTPNLQIVSSTGYNVVVKSLSGGNATITATFQNGQKVEKSVQIGSISSGSLTGTSAVCRSVAYYYYANVPGGHKAGYTYRWTMPNAYWQIFSQQDNFIYAGPVGTNLAGQMLVEVNNGCGWSGIGGIIVYPNYSCPIGYSYKIYPNPINSSTSLTLEKINTNAESNLGETTIKTNAITETETFEVEIKDLTGNTQIPKKTIKNKSQLDVSGLQKGVYILLINNKGEVSQEKIIIN